MSTCQPCCEEKLQQRITISQLSTDEQILTGQRLILTDNKCPGILNQSGISDLSQPVQQHSLFSGTNAAMRKPLVYFSTCSQNVEQ